MDMKALATELESQIHGEVQFDRYSRVLYSTDASIYQIEPVGVVVPRAADDVVAAVEIAAKHGVPLLPRGGGTGLAGQTVGEGLVLDFSKYMHQILELNLEERWVRVQPGLVLDELNHHLSQHGLRFAPDPASSNRATVGGAIGNNSCGAHSILYGKTVDHVKELKVVLSNGDGVLLRPLTGEGLESLLHNDSFETSIYREVKAIAEQNREEIDRRYPKIMRRVSGYNLDELLREGDFNLAKLVVGSEGTLGVVTEAKLSLVPQPKMTALAVLHFQDFIQALEATVEILGLGLEPSAIELIDKIILDQTRASRGFSKRMTFVEGEPTALLLVEFFGESERELRQKLDRLSANDQLKRMSYASTHFMDKKDQANVWAVRRAGLGLLMGIKGDAKPLPFVEDSAVAPEKLPDFVRRFDQIVQEHHTSAGYYGHASVGCIHIRPLIDLKNPSGLENLVSIATKISDLVLEFQGALSGEHGDGIVRGVWNEKMFGSRLYQALRQVKHAFDPKGIMNPGKIVDCPPMNENLRYGPTYRTLPVDTLLDFSSDSGFDRAVEMCSGIGACRKTLEGTMCPSYMATREETHSTRGRANALRAALSGQLPGELTGEGLYQVLDLCLKCKACKAECPSSVDMAKLKAEFLAHYYEKNGLPLRARLFGNIATINRIGCSLTPLSNWVAVNPLTRWILHRFLGIHHRRRLPPFARPTFSEWFKSRGSAPLGNGRETVVLFNDTFMNYNYPSIGKAATSLLELAGFQVILANTKCCGRPMISNGMLKKARAHARHNVDVLYPYVEQGAKIVGCEPSCVSTLQDDYLDLLGDEKTQKVAQNTYAIEEFLCMLQEEGRLGLKFTPTAKKVIFQGHCHQKALVGGEAWPQLLRLPPGFQVQELDAGCCGMAGAFGYEAEHYDLSMAIGGMSLFPAISSQKGEFEMAAPGVSCRRQIQNGTGRKVRHPVELLLDALAGEAGGL